MTDVSAPGFRLRLDWEAQPNPAVLNWIIWIGAAGFIAILALAAVFDPTIRVLHALQALMYVAVIWLTARGSRWGLFLGVSVAAFWNYMAMFVNNFFAAGLRALAQSFATGQVQHPDLVISVFAVAFHLAMILACLAAYLRLTRKSWADLAAWVATFALQTAYFVATVMLFQPRYLEQFGRILRPHGL